MRVTDVRKSHQRKRKYSPQSEAIELLAAEGLRNCVIASKLGVSRNVVAGVLDRERRRGTAIDDREYWREVDRRPLTSTFASRMNEYHRKLDQALGTSNFRYQLGQWRPVVIEGTISLPVSVEGVRSL